MKNEDMPKLIDRRLSGLKFQRQAEVLRGIRQPAAQPVRRRLRLTPAMAIVMALLLASTALAIGLSLSARLDARQRAVDALHSKFGLSEDTLGLFAVSIHKQGDSWVIRLSPKNGYPGDVGEYQVEVAPQGTPKATWTLESSPAYNPEAGLASPVWGHTEMMKYLKDTNAYQAKMAEVDWEQADEWSLQQAAQVDEMLAQAMPYSESNQHIKVVPQPGDLQPDQAQRVALTALARRYGVEQEKLAQMKLRRAFYQNSEDGSRFYAFTLLGTEPPDELNRTQSFYLLLSSPQGKVLKAHWFLPDEALRTLPSGSLTSYQDAAREYMAGDAFSTLSAHDKANLADRLAATGLNELLEGKAYVRPGPHHLTEQRALALSQAALEQAYGLRAESLDLFLPSLSLQQVQEDIQWLYELTPRMLHGWSGGPEPPIGQYTAQLDGETGQVIKTSWSLEHVDTATYTQSTWGQAKAYAGYILPWLESTYRQAEAIRAAAKDEHFLNVQEAAQHDQLYRDAGFPGKRFLSGLPRPGDLTQEQALKLAYETLRQVYGLKEDILDHFDLVWPSYLLHTGYQPFTSDQPFWIISFHHIEGIWVVALDAATGDILDVSYDPAASGNG